MDFDEEFQEEFVQVKDGKIIIECYYFPFGIKKVVNICDVKSIQYARQCDSYARNWGGNGLTWWACDMKRNFRRQAEDYHNVRLDNGGFFKKAFTVKDIVAFQRALRNDLKGCYMEKLDAL
ncbi:hypothetical protein Y032_0161g3381 [Ancylostoma ceylanicum]|uniref:Uncharacterized protein n=1 Tax=Ancylostoma ceylanicum TaxID=53326 RepID=A0A016SX64_9BILA|nr:hypothetical protein Y032_0161g3381 [Ancylostoma ceylanicum]